jgi:hypothetical protein
MRRSVLTAGAPIVAALGLAGCFGDEEQGASDAGEADAGAPVGSIDAATHDERCPGGSFTPPEGGEARIELVELAPDQQVLRHATEAYFFKDQTPCSREHFGPLIDLQRDEGDELPDSTVCLDTTAGTHFNVGAWPQNQEIADSRTYLNAGEQVSFKQRDGDLEIAMLASRPGDGVGGGTSRAQGKIHDRIYLAEDPSPSDYVVPQNTWFDLEVPGIGDIVAFTPSDGLNLIDGAPVAEFGVFFPSRFELLGPEPEGASAAAFEQHFFEKGVSFVEDEDFVFYLPMITAPGEDEPTTAYLVSLFDEHGRVHYQCLNTNARDEGSVTVPRELVERLPADSDGRHRGGLSIAHLSHFAFVFDHRRFNVLGAASKSSAQGWCVVDSAEAREELYFCPAGTFE